jgi:hypothetical protein
MSLEIKFTRFFSNALREIKTANIDDVGDTEQ